jgi:carboxyl-terminal processing protease
MNARLRVGLTLCTGVLLGCALSLTTRVFAQHDPAQHDATDTASDGALRGAAASPPGIGSEVLPWQDAHLLAEVLQRVRENYVDRVDVHQLMHQATRGMLEGLDEHSTLLDAREYAALQASTNGAYAGVGVEVEGVASGVRIVRCLADSPAEHAGLRAGDLVVRIDDKTVSAANLDVATDLLRGEVGSTVRLAVAREGHAPQEFLLRRSEVQLPSVAAETLAPGVGYLRISDFTNSTAAELAAAVARVRGAHQDKLRGLIIDLRNNPGGVLEAASASADAFLEQGIIVSADGRSSDARFRMDATPGDIAAGAPIVVLVNGGSASASEILAAALRQNDRATLIGRRTYGKGTVQTILPLSDGEALKLTTSRYYTPSGASINGVGITPDVILTGTDLAPADLDTGNGKPTLARRDSQVAAALAKVLSLHYATQAPRHAPPRT